MKKLLGSLLFLVMVATACGGGTSVTVGADGDGGAAAGEASSSGGGSFCEFAREREVQEDAFSNVNFFVPDELEEAFKQNRELMDRAVDVAPAAIKADLELIREELNVVIDAFDDVDWDAAAAAEIDIEDSPEVEAATDRVNAFIAEECGIDPDANEDDGPSDEEVSDMLDDSGNGDAFVRDILIQTGFSAEQAQCLSETISFDDFTDLSENQASSEILDRFTDCGVSLADLATLGGANVQELNDELPDLGDLPPGAADVFVDEMVKQGFTEDEATCLAGAMFSDTETAGQILAAFEACDIPISRFAELGDG